jgi:probable rRNA maturation factor
MILNRQRSVRVPIAELERFLARARRRLRIPADALTVCLVTPSVIARWNRAYRGKSRPTDVLSFPTNARQPKKKRVYDRRAPGSRKVGPRKGVSSTSFISSASSTSYLGDIAIAPSVARANARRFGRTFDDEMRILILHGILHLMGYDHETDAGQMDRREQGLRAELGLA